MTPDRAALRATAEAATGDFPCPHCDPHHHVPHHRVYGARLTDHRDHDGQPTQIEVGLTNGSHLCEADAAYVYFALNHAGPAVLALLDALDAAEAGHAAIARQRDEEFRVQSLDAAAIQRIRALTYASDDGTEFKHRDPDCDGESECDACWAADIRRALDGAQ